MPDVAKWGITIDSLTEADRFEAFEYRDPHTGATDLVDLVNWNPTYCFCAWPGTKEGGPTKPENLRRLQPFEQPMAFYVVYHNPSDYPGKWVLRRQRLLRGKPLIVIDFHPKAVVDSLEEARAALPEGLGYMGRFAEDDPAIFEVWM